MINMDSPGFKNQWTDSVSENYKTVISLDLQHLQASEPAQGKRFSRAEPASGVLLRLAITFV